MTSVAELLDMIVPPYDGDAGDWTRVLRDARVERRPRRASPGLAAAAAFAVAVVAAVSLWPSGGAGSSVIDRALAAAGHGEVLHLVYESELPKTLVDLGTGARTELRSEHEVWFDPQRGVRETERFEGVVQFDVALAASEVHEHARTIYTSLGAGYRDALASGDAEVVGEDIVAGTPVHWIRIESNGDGAHDVAVSRETFDPVAIRIGGGGETALTRIVAYDTVGAGEAPLDAAPAGQGQPALAEYRGRIGLDTASTLLGRAPVWAGAELDGLPLASIRELRLPASEGDAIPGLSVAYGSGDAEDPASAQGPHVEITQAAEPADGLTLLVGLRGYVPPDGTALLAGPIALLRSNGLVVAIHSPDEETAIRVARSLRPVAGR